MEINLEFQRYDGDTVSLLLSFVNLTILGSNPSPPVCSAAAAGSHLKFFSSMAERRFREAARTCIENGEGWASSSSPVNDMKAHFSSKLQTLGKHKLSSSDSMKPSMSKSRRTSVEVCESCPPLSEPIRQLNSVNSANDQHLGFDQPTVAPPILPSVEASDTEYTSYSDAFTNFSLDTESSDHITICLSLSQDFRIVHVYLIIQTLGKINVED